MRPHVLLAGTLLIGSGFALAAPAKAPAPQKATVRWHTTLASALAEAKKQHKPIFANFYADWCSPCHEMERTTYKEAAFLQEAGHWVLVTINAEKDKTNVAVAAKYKAENFPTMVALRPDGTLVKSILGFQKTPGLVKAMQSARSGMARKKQGG